MDCGTLSSPPTRPLSRMLDVNNKKKLSKSASYYSPSSPTTPTQITAATTRRTRRSGSLILNSTTTFIFALATASAGIVSADANLPGWGGYAPSDPNACIVLDQTNQFRAQNGRSALIGDARLDRAAQVQCQLMMRANVLEHDVGDGGPSVRVTNQGYNWVGVAENIYDEDNYGDVNVMRAVDGWEKSPGHRANMLGDYQSHGSTFCQKGVRTYWVQVFAKGDTKPSNEYLPYMCGSGGRAPAPPPTPSGPPPPGTNQQVAFHPQGSPEDGTASAGVDPNIDQQQQADGGGNEFGDQQQGMWPNEASVQQEQPAVASIAAPPSPVAPVYYPQPPPPVRPCRESVYGSKSLGYHALMRRSLLENEQSKSIKKSKRSVIPTPPTIVADQPQGSLMKRSKINSGPSKF